MKTAKGSPAQLETGSSTAGVGGPQVRLSVNLNPEVADELKAYAKRKGVSITEAVRRAVTVLVFVDETQRRGAALNVEEDGTLKEVLFL